SGVGDFLREREFTALRAWIDHKKSAARPERVKDVAELFAALADAEAAPIIPLNDIAVISRVAEKKMPWAGHGLMFRQDILSVSGRAAWAIEELLQVQLPEFRQEMSAED